METQRVNFSVQFPTIGPTFIHFYESSQKRTYAGRLLLSICAESCTEMNSSIPTKYPIPPIIEVS